MLNQEYRILSTYFMHNPNTSVIQDSNTVLLYKYQMWADWKTSDFIPLLMLYYYQLFCCQWHFILKNSDANILALFLLFNKCFFLAKDIWKKSFWFSFGSQLWIW